MSENDRNESKGRYVQNGPPFGDGIEAGEIVPWDQRTVENMSRIAARLKDAQIASEQINNPIRWDLMRAAEARNRPRAPYTPLRTVLGLGVVDTLGNVAWFAALLGSAFALGFALAVTIISGGFHL